MSPGQRRLQALSIGSHEIHLLVIMGSRFICAHQFSSYISPQRMQRRGRQHQSYLRPFPLEAQKAYDGRIFTIVFWEEQGDVANIAKLRTSIIGVPLVPLSNINPICKVDKTHLVVYSTTSSEPLTKSHSWTGCMSLTSSKSRLSRFV